LEEMTMKRAIAAAALTLFALAPASGMACEYGDDSWASTAPAEQVGTAPAPTATPVAAASKATASKVDKARASNPGKPVAAKTKATQPDQKLAASTTN
jgi:hypothetical protein